MGAEGTMTVELEAGIVVCDPENNVWEPLAEEPNP
jgi:hypothetical protein